MAAQESAEVKEAFTASTFVCTQN